MRCNYCGSNYGELPDVAKDLWLKGCYQCGARDFDSQPKYIPQALVTTARGPVPYIPQMTTGSGAGMLLGYGGAGGYGVVGQQYAIDNQSFRSGTISFEQSRSAEIDRAVTGGSTGYFNGQYQDFSGSDISEIEYTENQISHMPNYGINNHRGWDSLPAHVPELIQSIRSGNPESGWISRLFSGVLEVLD